MAKFPTMPLYTDALLSDAGDLPNELFGAYVRLLCRWWREGVQPEPNEKRLARWSGLTSGAFEDLKEFLTETPEGWTQKKLFHTWALALEKSEKARASANARWNSSDGNKTSSGGNAGGMLSNIQYPNNKKDFKNLKKGEQGKTETPLPDLRLPDDETGCANALALVKVCGEAACKSYFQPFPRKSANGKWVVFWGTGTQRDVIDRRFANRLDDIYGKNEWQFASNG